MGKEKREIRDLLLGKTVLDEEGRLTTPGAGTLRLPQGIPPGAGAVRFFGVGGKSRRYVTALEEKEILAEVRGGMARLGRAVRLREQPRAAACLIRYVLTLPVLLIFHPSEDGWMLTAWSGRGLTACFSRRRALHAFDKSLSALFAPGEEPEEARERADGGPEPSEERTEAPAPEAPENEEFPEEDWEE